MQPSPGAGSPPDCLAFPHPDGSSDELKSIHAESRKIFTYLHRMPGRQRGTVNAIARRLRRLVRPVGDSVPGARAKPEPHPPPSPPDATLRGRPPRTRSTRAQCVRFCPREKLRPKFARHRSKVRRRPGRTKRRRPRRRPAAPIRGKPRAAVRCGVVRQSGFRRLQGTLCYSFRNPRDAPR